MASAQELPSTKPVPPDSVVIDPTNSMDVLDLLKLVLKKPNLFHRKENSKGPFIVAIPYPGYTLVTGVAVVVPVNISFYTNDKKRDRLSFFNNNFQYTQYKQIVTGSFSDIYLQKNKLQLIGDWRYYNFPTHTYGLGSLTALSDADKINYSYLRIYESAIYEIAPHLSAGLGYGLDYHWNIQDYAAQSGIVTDFQRYGYAKNSVSSGVTANLIYDSRDRVNNPKAGVFFSLQFRANLTALGSNSNWNSLIFEGRKYVRLPTKWYMELAFRAALWLTPSGTPPYLELPSTGWGKKNQGRGYVQGRFTGLDMVYLETEFRFSIMRNGFLGGVIFVNAQSLSEWPSNIFVAVQPAVGFGLRIKLNKKTNTNSALDYGFGTGGSRGFAFNLNEVF